MRWLPLLSLFVATTAAAQVTPFSDDVMTGIDNGLAWHAAQGHFDNPSTCPPSQVGVDGAGLVALAMLEKRVDSDPNSISQGYLDATPANQALLDSAMAYIIPRATGASFQAYRDGADLMAISLYWRTGGPDAIAALAAIHAIFDRMAVNQGPHGYWCYTNGACMDSSTTQFVMSGLAGARNVFLITGDAARLATLDALTANARAGYVANSLADGLSPDARGHGYRAGNPSSIQQTASGLWGQIVGGATINDPTVQAYLRWLQDRYRHSSSMPVNGGFPSSHYYYLWSATKGFNYLADTGIAAAPGNLSPDDLGLIAPGGAPANADREIHLDPLTAPRPALFGPEGAGYYNADAARWYFDYAYGLLTEQDAAGQFITPAPHSVWNACSGQAYAILVLERSTGGGCPDADGDGICDPEDNCVDTPNADQVDLDGNGIGDACEEICCQLCTGETITTTADQCALSGGDAVDHGLCCPVICCEQADGTLGMVHTEDCLPAGGTALPDAACEVPEPEDVCCQTADGSVISSAEDCEAHGGVPAAAEQCEEICCHTPDGTALTNAAHCAELGGVADTADQCEAICCRVQAGFVTITGLDCGLSGGEPAPADLCDEQPAEICCQTADGAGQLTTPDDCEAAGGVPNDAAQCEEICCRVNGGFETLSGLACASAGGLPAPAEHCVEQAAQICCKGPNGLEQLSEADCVDLGGDPLDISWCEEPICCARDDIFNSEPAIQCEINGGIEVPAEECMEQICCRIPNAVPAMLTLEACADVDGLPADIAHCADPDAPGEEQLDASARPIAHPDAANTVNDDGCSTAPGAPSGAWWLLALPLLLRRRRR